MGCLVVGPGFAFSVLERVGDGGSRLGHRGREAGLHNPTGFSSWFRGRPRESRRGAHARIPVALHRSMNGNTNPLPPFMATTVESHGALPLFEAEAPNPLPSSMSTTVESRKDPKAPGPTKWGRPCSPTRSMPVSQVPPSGGVSGRVSMRDSLPVLSRWTFHRLDGQGRGTGPVGSGGLPGVFGSSFGI